MYLFYTGDSSTVAEEQTDEEPLAKKMKLDGIVFFMC